MAAPFPSDKVKDKEYTNWLKVTLALYYMKSGLHTFLQSEIDCLHQSLVQNIYGGPTIPLPPCTMCNASCIKRNKFTGVWAFQKQCGSFCDVWLHELLKLHTNPKSDKIYWNNSDIPSWPFKPWECAKAFMPRGQQPSNAGPSECDAQALLTLLASCTHFHFKLSSQGLGLTHTMSTIRNNIIHNGEMKVSDTERRNCIQQIIQLLEDPVSLKSLEDCKVAAGNIHKINNDSVDVFFNVDLEMKALRALVNEVSQELGMQKTRTLDTVDSLKEEYRQLREQLAKRLEDVGTRMDTIERDVQSVKEHTDTVLQQQEKKYQEMQAITTLQQTKRIGNVETRMDTIERDVQSVMEHTDTALQQQEKKHQQSMETTSASIVKHGIRLDAVEKNVVKLQEEIGQMSRGNNSCVKETRIKRRQESDGLRQLKNQTEDKLDTLGRLEYIHRTQTEQAKKLLEEKRSIVIKGNPGEGKTTMALHLIDNEIYRDRRVVLYHPRHWEAVDTDWVDIVMMEDAFGKFDLDPGRLQEWMVYLPTIQEHIDAGKLQVIITSRIDIFSKTYSKFGSLKLFADDLSVTLSSEKLANSEKMNILNRELCRHNRRMKENDKEKCITNFSGLIGFPQCCSIFAVDDNLFDRGPDFFSSPRKFFVKNITELEPTRFLPLAFLFCNGKICEEYLSPDTMPETSKHLFMELSYRLSKEKADITLLRDAYNRFLELYVVKCISCDCSFSLDSEKPCIQFTHATVCEAVGQVLGDHCLEMVVKYGDSEYLYQRTYTAETKDSTSENVFLPVYVYGLLAERMVSDVVEKGLVRSVVKHSALKQGQFIKTFLKDELCKDNTIKKLFFIANPDFDPEAKPIQFTIRLSEGECLTFLQYILQGDDDIVRLVYNEFLEFLECAHNYNKSCCWQCVQKQMLLELALYYHHLNIADKLITMNARYTHVSLSNAARHGHLRRVQTILETLKRSQDFNPKCFEAKEALYRAYLSGNQSLIDVLLKEEITLDSKHVVDVVTHGDVNALKKVVEHLKCHDNWNPHLEQYEEHQDFFLLDFQQYRTLWDSLPEIVEVPFTKALCIAYCHEKFYMSDYLLKNQVKLAICILASVSKAGSQQSVYRVIQNLKLAGVWDPLCHDASKALEEAYCAQKYEACDLLMQEGVSLTMKNLSGATCRFQVSFESIQKVIQHLKDTNTWDPKCDDASNTLEYAYSNYEYDICDLLFKEGVSLTMVHIPHVIMRSLDYLKMSVKYLRDTDSWDPKRDEASEALINAYCAKKYDVCDLLIQEGVSLTMKGLCQIISSSLVEPAIKAITQLKNTDSFDPKCGDALEALRRAYSLGSNMYEVCDLLVQEGVSLMIELIPEVIRRSYNDVEKAVKQLKDAKCWDPKCHYAFVALLHAYREQKYDICHVLIREGVSLPMWSFFFITILCSVESVMKAIKQLKDTDSWDPKCDSASLALTCNDILQNYDMCDLLIQEGVSLTIKLLPTVSFRSLDHVQNALKQLKDTNSWDPECADASNALVIAYSAQKYNICNLLIQEGVSLSMRDLPALICRSLDDVKAVVKQLKDTERWDPKCNDASNALAKAYCNDYCDVCDFLLQEGVSLTMKNLPCVLSGSWVSLESVKKAVQHLKDTNQWIPSSDDAKKIFAETNTWDKKDIRDFLINKGLCYPEFLKTK